MDILRHALASPLSHVPPPPPVEYNHTSEGCPASSGLALACSSDQGSGVDDKLPGVALPYVFCFFSRRRGGEPE